MTDLLEKTKPCGPRSVEGPGGGASGDPSGSGAAGVRD